MIQDIFPHTFSNNFSIPEKKSDEDYIFHFKDNSLLLKSQKEDYCLPQRKDLKNIPDINESIFLFTLNGRNCFLIWDIPETDPNRFTYQEINFFRTFGRKEVAWVSIVGHQLYTWYTQNKYCGKCGAKTAVKTDERAIICPVCNHVVYPKISPAVIVAIISNDKILLAHNSNFRSNWYSLVAGYADIGESLEETVIREVKEEVGLDITNIRYYKSQPWPFSGSMMIGFFADADDKQLIRPDNKEISDASWFQRGKLPNHPTTFSIAGEMIELFENNQLINHQGVSNK
jgi:NAD+ diphosphatase